MNNIFNSIPDSLDAEITDSLLRQKNGIRIERIVSTGQCSPDSGWYDQEENEWVLLIQGTGIILFEDGSETRLEKGDFLNIPSHTRHRVKWTDPEQTTVWIAIFYA